MITIRAAGITDIPDIQKLAEKTWYHTYRNILSADQLVYMLDAIYSKETLEQVMITEQKFILLIDSDSLLGFASFGKVPEREKCLKLHKIYVDPDQQNNGYGKLLIDEVKRQAIHEGNQSLILNVNRFNRAKNFYEKEGFVVEGQEDIPIGPYWMNDYVLRFDFTKVVP